MPLSASDAAWNIPINYRIHRNFNMVKTIYHWVYIVLRLRFRIRLSDAVAVRILCLSRCIVLFLSFFYSSIHHHHHHFICPIIQQYAHLHRYNFRRAGQQGPTRTLKTAVKSVIKQLLGTYSITHVKYYKRETREINLFNDVPNTFKDAKFTVDGSAFQTLITLSTKNFCLILASIWKSIRESAIHIWKAIHNFTRKAQFLKKRLFDLIKDTLLTYLLSY